MSTSSGNWTPERLAAAEAAGDRLKFLLFWGHTAPASGEIGPHVLSQWYPHEFVLEGTRYRTAEHFMMAAKAQLFDDAEALEAVLASGSPGAAKAIGRRVRDFDEATWQAHREEIVTTASVAKFGSDAGLRSYLLGTGNRVLVEASPTDRIWGIGMTKDDPEAQIPSKWRGANLLGFALMRARAILEAETAPG